MDDILSALARLPARLVANAAVRRGPYPDHLKATLSHAAESAALARISRWPGYAPTPLVSLAPLAESLGVAGIAYKHEASRFGLGSFKALGGAYAVQRLAEDMVMARTGTRPTFEDLTGGRHDDILSTITVTCATDGNHGRSVAWGARMFGIGCVIVLHETVSQGREDAIARYGARIVRTPGNYDDSVRHAAEEAARHGWHVVSDTSYPGYVDIPRHVMQGYAVMAAEAIDQMGGTPPSHIFIQGGVGGLAAAITAHVKEAFGADSPIVVVVEPDKAACLLESAIRGEAVAVGGALDTVMAGLACGEPSIIAWPVLADGAAFFMDITDEAAMETMRLLASAEAGPPLAGGESGVAGLAGLLCLAGHPDWRQAIGLDRSSRVLVFGSEGATDPDVYAAIVGRSADDVEPVTPAEQNAARAQVGLDSLR